MCTPQSSSLTINILQARPIISTVLTFFTLSNASRLVPVYRPKDGSRQKSPPTGSSETINGEQQCIPACEDSHTAVIVNGIIACVESKPSCEDGETAGIVNGVPGCVLPGPPTSQAPGAAGSTSTCHANVSVAIWVSRVIMACNVQMITRGIRSSRVLVLIL